MQPTIDVIRAISAVFVRRRLRPFIIGGVIVALLLVAGGGWLAAQNAWWWFLEVVLIVGSLLFFVLIGIVQALLRKVTPSLSEAQKRSTAEFVDKLERVADTVQTPQLIIMYYVVRDALRPRSGGFIETLSHDSKSLAADFNKLCSLFERKHH